MTASIVVRKQETSPFVPPVGVCDASPLLILRTEEATCRRCLNSSRALPVAFNGQPLDLPLVHSTSLAFTSGRSFPSP
jgi:hypothetical protein